MKKIYLLIILTYVCIKAEAQCNVKAFPVDTTVCLGSVIQLYDSGDVGTCIWSPSTGLSDSNVCNPFAVALYATTYTVTLITNSDTCTATATIRLFPPIPLPVITRMNDTLYINDDPSYASYQWYKGATPIPGATDTLIVADTSSNYVVTVMDIYGCSISVSMGIVLLSVSGVIEQEPFNINVSPNPATNQLTITSSLHNNEAVTVSVINMLGQVTSPPAPLLQERGVASIDVSKLPAGIYFLELKAESRRVVKKFVKE